MFCEMGGLWHLWDLMIRQKVLDKMVRVGRGIVVLQLSVSLHNTGHFCHLASCSQWRTSM